MIMGEVDVVLEGKQADIQRIYDFMSYHVKAIKPARVEKKQLSFSVVV